MKFTDAPPATQSLKMPAKSPITARAASASRTAMSAFPLTRRDRAWKPPSSPH
jgi:hypothetical protein